MSLGPVFIIGAGFGLATIPDGVSIEQLFEDAIKAKDQRPIDQLYDLLMGADYFLGMGLCCGQVTNSYLTFLERFRDSHFLTFNYDSLVEILLFHLRRWRPEDGYGMSVEAGL